MTHHSDPGEWPRDGRGRPYKDRALEAENRLEQITASINELLGTALISDPVSEFAEGVRAGLREALKVVSGERR